LLIGNVTRDPEIRFTAKGTPVAELGLADVKPSEFSIAFAVIGLSKLSGR